MKRLTRGIQPLRAPHLPFPPSRASLVRMVLSVCCIAWTLLPAERAVSALVPDKVSGPNGFATITVDTNGSWVTEPGARPVRVECRYAKAWTTVAGARWIWANVGQASCQGGPGSGPAGLGPQSATARMSTTFNVPGEPQDGVLKFAADNSAVVYVNGKLVDEVTGAGTGNYSAVTTKTFTAGLFRGRNTLTIVGTNAPGGPYNPAGVIASLAVTFATTSVPARGVVVNPAVQYQTLEGWGTSLAWFAHILGKASDPARKRIVNLLFNPQTGLGLNVVRYNIGGGENPAYHFLQPRTAMPGYEPARNKWNWSADRAQRWFLRQAMVQGADQLEAFSNSPPYWMTVSGSVTGSKTGGANNIRSSDYGAFADYLARVVHHFERDWGTVFRTLEPFNEPVSTWWKFGGKQEGCHISHAAQARIIADLHTALVRDRSGTQIAAPDDNSIDQTVTTWNSYPVAVRDEVRQVNTHSYQGGAGGTLVCGPAGGNGPLDVRIRGRRRDRPHHVGENLGRHAPASRQRLGLLAGRGQFVRPGLGLSRQRS